MRIVSCEFFSSGKTWSFSRVELARTNLLVGDSSTGKTRFLNSLFNIARFAVGSHKNIDPVRCVINLQINNCSYDWELETDVIDSKFFVKNEILRLSENGMSIELVNRTIADFKFKNKSLPKLSIESSCIVLLKEEEDIKPLFSGFSNMLRRNFYADELVKNVNLEALADEVVTRKVKSKDELFQLDSGLNIKLFIAKKLYPDLFNSIIAKFIEVFPFIQSVDIKDLKEIRPDIIVPGLVPVIAIKEKNVEQWIPIIEISSGMLKVLIILSDMHLMPQGAIYLVDEYENSLGISAINFFPSFLNEFDGDIQVIMTSHHPYIINNIPPENWLIFHRKGSSVHIKYGTQIADKFSKSKQQRFIQLINDSFYVEGIE